MRRKVVHLVALAFLASFVLPAGSEEKPPQLEPPEVIYAEEPVYPVNTVYPGTVVLAVTIDPAGEIEDVKVVRESPGFTAEALRAIKKWRFRPAKLDGKPMRSVVPVAFSFSRPPVWWPRPQRSPDK